MFTLKVTKSLEEVVTAYNMQFHTYADDTQLYLNFQPDNECENQLKLKKLQCCLDQYQYLDETLFPKIKPRQN